ncbi:hypothetical protein D3C80_1835150 [compost metagenome]
MSQRRLRDGLNQQLRLGGLFNEFFGLLDEIKKVVELQIISIVVLPDSSAGPLDIGQPRWGANDARVQGLGQGDLLFQK